jgi:hypothetical protein
VLGDGTRRHLFDILLRQRRVPGNFGKHLEAKMALASTQAPNTDCRGL